METKTSTSNAIKEIEAKIQAIQANHPVFDDHFSRSIATTREDLGLRISNLVAFLINQRYKEKAIDSMLCNRDCCKVVTTYGIHKSNVDIVVEGLSSDDICMRKNTVNAICYMFNDRCKEIRYKAKYILMKAIAHFGEIIYNKGDRYDNAIRRKVDFLLLERNIGAALNNEDCMRNLLSKLKTMLNDRHMENVVTDIIEKMLSNENIGVTLGKKDFVDDLPSLLKIMLGNEHLKNVTDSIIEKLFSSAENINILLKSIY